MKAAHEILAKSLRTKPEVLEKLESEMQKKGFPPVLASIEQKNEQLITRTLEGLGVKSKTAGEVREALFEQVLIHEKELYKYIGVSPADFSASDKSLRQGSGQAGDAFEKIAQTARKMATEDKGYFLKKENAKEILRKRPPEQTMRYLGYNNVEEMLTHEDIGDLFSALRFTETNEWMHKTFDEAYRKFTPNDFEERKIELRVLGSQWKEIAEKYVAKKHHNVSHLKEFGIIFLNPIAETEGGKFLRDFALLLHYFHEIAFYSKLFRRYAEGPDFSTHFISALRGDVSEPETPRASEWLITQRYLWKENPEDPRLSTPHVNPESKHWRKAQEDIVAFGESKRESGLEFWNDLWAVGGWFDKKIGGREYISFELEDNAMGAASKSDGENQTFSYHQHEALWNKIFSEYVGGYDKLDQYILENMEKGKITLS